jgi:exodeoxyribonuclease VII small subunit
MRSGEITYKEAITELETIIAQIEKEGIDVDVLAEKVKRASYLIKLCRSKLKSTDEEVKKVLADIEEDNEERVK